MRTLCLSGAFLLGSMSVFISHASSDDTDTKRLVPTSIKKTDLKLNLDGHTCEIPLEYALDETAGKGHPSLFVLPVWAVEKVERVVGKQRTTLTPSDPLIPPDEKGPVQLNVTVRNLLEKEETKEAILNHLQQHVAKELALQQRLFRYEKPEIKEDEAYFTLIGPGRGIEPEIVLSNAVLSANGLLGFDLDIPAIRRCEQVHGLKGGLALGNVTILPTGPMKVRFERLEFEAQISYMHHAVADLRKRVGSSVNPSGRPPDVIISLSNDGLTQVKNKINSMVGQSLSVVVSTRQGTTDTPPLQPLLEKAVKSLLQQSEVDSSNNDLRVTFLMENQVSITATLGEFKKLSQIDEKARAEAIRQAYDHYVATVQGKAQNYSGELNVGYALWNVGLSGNYSEDNKQSDAKRDQEQRQQFQHCLDKVLKSFEGNIKLPTGLHVSDQALHAIEKNLEAHFAQRKFDYDYTLHRFRHIRLTGSTDVGATVGDWMRKYAQLKADHDAALAKLQEAHARHEQLQLNQDLMTVVQTHKGRLAELEALLKAAGKAEDWAKAKMQMERVAKTADELAKALDGAPAAKVMQLQKEIADLRKSMANVSSLAAANTATIDDFQQQFEGLKTHLSGLQLRSFHGHTDWIRGVAFSPNGKLLATASDDGTARVWDAKTGEVLGKFRHAGWVYAVAFSSDGTLLATAVHDGTAQIWDIETGQQRCVLRGHTDWVRAVAFTPDNRLLATASGDGTARLWDVDGAKQLLVLRGHKESVRAVAFDPDGKLLATGSRDGTVCLWNVATGEKLQVLTGHSGWVQAVTFSADGKLLASSDTDGTAKIWDVRTGKQLRTLDGHSGYVYCVSFCPKSRYVATACTDGLVRIWNVQTWKLLHALRGHSDSVLSVAFEPSGKLIASSSADKSVKIWYIGE
ncbi:MAG: hypothetical protein RMJ82_15255 [Gemmatales bacterium]|nr:hypothetical protein [Gemmatales bacterium]